MQRRRLFCGCVPARPSGGGSARPTNLTDACGQCLDGPWNAVRRSRWLGGGRHTVGCVQYVQVMANVTSHDECQSPNRYRIIARRPEALPVLLGQPAKEREIRASNAGELGP